MGHYVVIFFAYVLLTCMEPPKGKFWSFVVFIKNPPSYIRTRGDISCYHLNLQTAHTICLSECIQHSGTSNVHHSVTAYLQNCVQCEARGCIPCHKEGPACGRIPYDLRTCLFAPAKTLMACAPCNKEGPAICVMLCITCSVSSSPQGSSHELTFPSGGFLIALYFICFPRTSHQPVTFCAFHKSVLVPFKAYVLIIPIIITLQNICQPNFALPFRQSKLIWNGSLG